MRKCTLFFAALFFFIVAQSQTVITVQHGNATTLEKRLDSAIAHAQTGDIIYLPGGLVSGTYNLTIKKKVTIIGAGYHPDSSTATTPSRIENELIFGSGADGTLITGIFSSGNIRLNASNIIISRSNIQSLSTELPVVSNLLIEENIIRDYFYGRLYISSSFPNCVFKKNIIYGKLQGMMYGDITFSNNIFLYHQFHVYNCLFENNIFLNTAISFDGPNQFTNNLFVGSPSISSADGNIFNEPLENIFLNYIQNAAWDKSQNFHLKAGCKGIGLGTDSKDVGIYGSTSPFKDGGIPFNPHYQSVIISSATNSSGLLNINIAVKAQNN